MKTKKNVFGKYVRKKRMALYANDKQFSLRKVAQRISVEPSYLSKVERAEQPPPSEKKIILLAKEIGEDKDMLLALAGKVSSDLQAVIRKRPELFAQLIQELKNLPDNALLHVIREVRDGKW